MISFSYLSKIGDRKVNEDFVDVVSKESCYLFALADGLGGHSSGDIASKLVVSKAKDVYLKCEGGNDCIPLCFISAQNALMEEQDVQKLDMKTTLVLLGISDNTAQWGHIGDSRLYHFQDGQIISRTNDHSVPQMLYMTGEIRDKDIRFHPDRNRLLRVMGIEWDRPRFELSGDLAIIPGISFLLCTDGFWELIDEKHMCRCLKAAETPEEWLSSMENIIVKNGKGKNMDNYSAVAVWLR